MINTGYLLVTFFMLGSLLITVSYACYAAGIVYNRKQLIALRLPTLFVRERPTVLEELSR